MTPPAPLLERYEEIDLSINEGRVLCVALKREKKRRYHHYIIAATEISHASTHLRTVTVIRGDVQYRLLTQRHLHDAFVPPFDDGTGANVEFEGFVAIDAAVKLLAVGGQGSGVTFAN